MPRKSGKNTPTVKDGILYTNDPQTTGIRLSNPAEWYAWLLDAKAFYFEGKTGFQMRQEKRRNSVYWYAYRRFGRVAYKLFAGASEVLTLDRLSELDMKYAEIAGKAGRK